jgi:hypothetical protein
VAAATLAGDGDPLLSAVTVHEPSLSLRRS